MLYAKPSSKFNVTDSLAQGLGHAYVSKVSKLVCACWNHHVPIKTRQLWQTGTF